MHSNGESYIYVHALTLEYKEVSWVRNLTTLLFSR